LQAKKIIFFKNKLRDMENSDELIEKLKQRNLKPKPVWHFSLQTAFYWFLFLMSVILGALAFSIILYSIQQVDFGLVAHMSHSGLEFLLGLAPFFWIISLIIFLFVAMVGIRKSKKGYKVSYTKIIAFSASFSILAGTLFFIGGGGEWLDNAFSSRVSLYEGVQTKKIELWSKPENGHLAGTITDIGEAKIELIDFNNQVWKIDLEKANIPNSVQIEEGEKIKIIGEIISPNTFLAKQLRPWGGNGGGPWGPKRKGPKK